MMLTNFNTKPILLNRLKLSSVLEKDNYRVYWEGFIFVNGISSGIESIAHFIENLTRLDIKDACLSLKGIFFLVVEDKLKGTFYAFVDNSGLYQAFYTDNMISNSFLELIAYNKNSLADLDPEAIIEFLFFGNLFFNKTFIKSIKRIPQDTIIKLSIRENTFHLIQKSIPDISSAYDCSSLKSFYETFESLVLSIGNQRVSLDLTGGTDTRLIAVLLDHFGLEFETSVSGGTTDYEDIAISQRVAHSIRHSWHCTIHSMESFEEDIPELFYSSDGLYDIMHFHRLFQLQKARIERGITLMISGVGGEFFKDYWWLQDFPFYSQRTSNIERFVDLRIMPHSSIKYLLTDDLSGISQSFRNNLIKKISSYRLDINTKTYDNISFKLKMREEAGRELTNYSPYMKCYAPFLDLDLVRLGFNLQRRQRVFNIFQKRLLMNLNPAVAEIPTTENGISASLSLRKIMRDVPLYVSDKLNRVLVKLKIKNIKRSIGLNHPDFYIRARKAEVLRESLEILKEINFIHNKIQFEQIKDNDLGSILTLGMLIKFISNRKLPQKVDTL